MAPQTISYNRVFFCCLTPEIESNFEVGPTWERSLEPVTTVIPSSGIILLVCISGTGAGGADGAGVGDRGVGEPPQGERGESNLILINKSISRQSISG